MPKNVTEVEEKQATGKTRHVPKKRMPKVAGLLIALVAVLVFGVLMAGGLSGWFDDPKVELDASEYDTTEIINIDGAEYENMVKMGRSFVVLVDQTGCSTARGLEENLVKYQEIAGFRVYRLMFEELKQTSLYNYVHFYPSVVVVDRGTPRKWLWADSADDAMVYNDYDELTAWFKSILAEK